MILSVKLGLVAILLFFGMTHDLILGLRVGRIVQLPSESRSGLDHVLFVELNQINQTDQATE